MKIGKKGINDTVWLVIILLAIVAVIVFLFGSGILKTNKGASEATPTKTTYPILGMWTWNKEPVKVEFSITKAGGTIYAEDCTYYLINKYWTMPMDTTKYSFVCVLSSASSNFNELLSVSTDNNCSSLYWYARFTYTGYCRCEYVEREQ